MRSVVIKPEYHAWRTAARQLLGQGLAPQEVLWTDDPQEASLFAEPEPEPASATAPAVKVPTAFLDLARRAAAHTDPQRWALLYRLLWRLTLGGERHLLSLATDREVRQLQDWNKSIGRDIHKMHAFVRFRKVGVDAATHREQFVAWFEPDFRIVRLAAPFFEKRFASMDWSILTPYECAHWDGQQLHFTPGVPRSQAPDGDVLDDLWRTYYKNIFNPARVKINAMQSEMPKKYWKNLPEAPLIADLIAESAGRVQSMLDTPERPALPAPHNAYLQSLRARDQPPPPPPGEGTGSGLESAEGRTPS